MSGFFDRNTFGCKSIIVVLIIISTIAGCTKGTKGFYPAADFEECETVYVGWNIREPEYTADLVKTIAPYENITLVFDGGRKNIKKVKKQLLDNGISLINIQYLPLDLDVASIWLRDVSPVFLFNKNGDDKILLVNKAKEEEAISAKHFLKRKIRLSKDDLFTSVGGCREFNGKGTVILVKQYERYSNSHLTQNQIEFYYKTAFNQTNIIWLNKGLVCDEANIMEVGNDIYNFDGTNGHVDEFCRFINDSTLLLAEVDSVLGNRNFIMAENYKRLEENYDILKNSTLEDGRKIKIIRVPVAPDLAEEEMTGIEYKYFKFLVTSYLNFLITDKTIILPSYDKYIKDNDGYIKSDERTARIFKEIAPNHKVLFCDAYKLNTKGGGFHCVSYNKTKKRKG